MASKIDILSEIQSSCSDNQKNNDSCLCLTIRCKLFIKAVFQCKNQRISHQHAHYGAVSLPFVGQKPLGDASSWQ